jgi:uroporphyrinogen-III synthase
LPISLLITRPHPGAARTAGRAHGEGMTPHIMPLFQVAPRTWSAPDAAEYDAILFTSANAIQSDDPNAMAQLAQLRTLPILAVGNVTSAKAASAGLRIAMIGTSGSDALISQIQGTSYRRLLWLCGADHGELSVLPEMAITKIITYASVKQAAPADFTAQIAQADVVTLHSARAAARFAYLCTQHSIARDQIAIACLSGAIAAAAGCGWRRIITAPAPDDRALLSAISSSFRLSA